MQETLPIFGQHVNPPMRRLRRHSVQMRALGQIVANNIEALQARSDLSWKLLQKKSGVSQSTITRWRRQESSPTIGKVQNLAAALRVDVWQLFFDGAPMSSAKIAQSPIPYGFTRIERLDVEASAGPGSIPPDHPDVIEHLEISTQWMRNVLGVSDAERLRIISARGDSMSPTINNADLAFVDISQNYFSGDAIYAIVWHDELMIKRLQAISDGGVRIVSDNHAYPPQEIHQDDIETLTICGRVVGWWTLRRY